MSNPAPVQSEAFKNNRLHPIGRQALNRKGVYVRFYPKENEILDRAPNKSAFIRQVMEALIDGREGEARQLIASLSNKPQSVF